MALNEDLLSQFPVISFKKLFHVGTMKKEDKQPDSMEGEGLSVSECPDEWRKITKLMGDLYSLKKADNCFLNFHGLDDNHMKIIIKWGLENVFIEPCKVYKVPFYDGDFDMEMFYIFIDYEEAKKEADEMEEEIEVTDGYRATGKMVNRTLNDWSPALVLDLLSTLYAEDVLNIDGVYWNDELDVSILSAPRAVINLTHLESWKIKKIAIL